MDGESAVAPVQGGGSILMRSTRDRDQPREAIQELAASAPAELPVRVWAATAEEQAARVEPDPWEDKVAELCKGEVGHGGSHPHRGAGAGAWQNHPTRGKTVLRAALLG